MLLAFGLLVVVPMGLDQTRRLGVHLALRRSVPAAAILGAASLLLAPGVPAALPAAAWLIACILLTLSGLSSLAASRSLGPRTVLPVAALGYLAVGAGWLVASRLGARPLGFSDEIVQLTAVHFHFAGFAAPLIAAAAADALQARLPRWAAATRGGGMGVVGAMPLVAAGFVFSEGVAAAGVSLLAASLGVVAAGLLALVVRPAHSLSRVAPRALLGLAAASVLIAMALAVAYAVGPFLGVPALGIPAMAAFHGTANAVGFCAGGLAGFALGARRDPQP
jgi:hypothetical protein